MCLAATNFTLHISISEVNANIKYHLRRASHLKNLTRVSTTVIKVITVFNPGRYLLILTWLK